MLKIEDYIKVGTLNKPHGVYGELNFGFAEGLMNEETDYPFIFLNHDGCVIPYAVDDISFINDQKGYIQLEDIANNEAASQLTGQDIYLLNTDISDSEVSEFNHLLIGFTVYDQNDKKVGEITGFMDIPGNPVIEVKTTLSETLVPFNEELILNFSKENKSITLNIAEGLL